MAIFRVNSVTELESGIVLVAFNDGTTIQLNGMEAFYEMANPDSINGILENVAKNIAVCLFNKMGAAVTLVVDMKLESQIIMEANTNG